MRFFRLLNTTIHLKNLHKSTIKSSYNLIIPQLHNNLTSNPNFNIYKRSHVGHSHSHNNNNNNHEDDEISKEGERIFRLGLAADIGLTVGKVVTGYLSGSTAIIADAAHSLSDVVLSGVALVSFRASRVPRDKEHPYGHGKFETLGALGISGVLLVTAGGIGWHALDVLVGIVSATSEITNQSLLHEHAHSDSHHGIDMNHPILALNTTIIAIAVKEGLYWMTKRAGERVGSGLMKANAWHHRADAVSSLVALIGVGGSILGVSFLDPLAGLVVSGMIFKAGVQTGYQSILELVDAAIPSRDLDPFRKTVVQVDGVKASFLTFLITCMGVDTLGEGGLVDPLCSISTAHQIGENVRHQIQNSHPEVSEVFIQLEPAIKQEVAAVTYDSCNIVSGDNGIEEMVTDILSSKFPEKLIVKRVIKRMSRGKILLQIEVSMPSDVLISDAMRVAEEAKSHILLATNNSVEEALVNSVSEDRSSWVLKF
nr:metal tolerance protein 2 [Tanacetum cinerariifolium]